MCPSCHSTNVESIVTFTPYTSKHFQCSGFSRSVDCLLNDSDHRFHQSIQCLWYILIRKCPKWLNGDFHVAMQLIHFCRPICCRYFAFKATPTWLLKCTGTCHAWSELFERGSTVLPHLLLYVIPFSHDCYLKWYHCFVKTLYLCRKLNDEK